ncbi:MAG: 2OG-Fe(II) oxygenase superfamily [Idiomarinaceae bacterium HL-53]|nr:MAG: 2OG-Fe(II) oxygenase superfamily [Idiomarinaceae bacterium HL-53]CUS48712.1 2OG-Fe(II) oxygenase superfamily protein [Idiomarinaceae bacterium HL-53]
MSDFIGIYDNALPDELCEELIAVFESSPHLVEGKTGHGVEKDKKVSHDLYLDQHAEYQSLVNRVRTLTAQKILEYFQTYHFGLIAPVALKVKHPLTGQVVNLTHENFAEVAKGNEAHYMKLLYRLGAIQAQRYRADEGNYNYWHCEVYPQPNSTEALHRTLLFMFYLNDVAEGGTTDFYYQNKQIEPRKGRMVIAPAYFTHTHRGTTPRSNDKYILTSWVLMNPGNVLFQSR